MVCYPNDKHPRKVRAPAQRRPRPSRAPKAYAIVARVGTCEAFGAAEGRPKAHAIVAWLRASNRTDPCMEKACGKRATKRTRSGLQQNSEVLFSKRIMLGQAFAPPAAASVPVGLGPTHGRVPWALKTRRPRVQSHADRACRFTQSARAASRRARVQIHAKRAYSVARSARTGFPLVVEARRGRAPQSPRNACVGTRAQQNRPLHGQSVRKESDETNPIWTSARCHASALLRKPVRWPQPELWPQPEACFRKRKHGTDPDGAWGRSKLRPPKAAAIAAAPKIAVCPTRPSGDLLGGLVALRAGLVSPRGCGGLLVRALALTWPPGQEILPSSLVPVGEGFWRRMYCLQTLLAGGRGCG